MFSAGWWIISWLSGSVLSASRFESFVELKPSLGYVSSERHCKKTSSGTPRGQAPECSESETLVVLRMPTRQHPRAPSPSARQSLLYQRPPIPAAGIRAETIQAPVRTNPQSRRTSSLEKMRYVHCAPIISATSETVRALGGAERGNDELLRVTADRQSTECGDCDVSNGIESAWGLTPDNHPGPHAVSSLHWLTVSVVRRVLRVRTGRCYAIWKERLAAGNVPDSPKSQCGGRRQGLASADVYPWAFNGEDVLHCGAFEQGYLL